MDDLRYERLSGRLSAQMLLIEHLYWLIAKERPDLAPILDGMREAQLTMVDEDQPANSAHHDREQVHRISQFALHQLEVFWERFDRLQTPLSPEEARRLLGRDPST